LYQVFMDTKQIELIERLRRLFQGEPSLREVSMFGGRSFMVDGKIVVGAMKAGDLLVRIPPERHQDLIAQPGVSQPAMGAGRSMGPSWIRLRGRDRYRRTSAVLGGPCP
jgi:hypothetical protein